MQVLNYEEIDVDDYDVFVKEQENSLIYLSSIYKKLLENILDAESKYLIAVQNNAIVGVLPTFIKRNVKYGNVINSLPFYGSNGGFLCKTEEARNALLEAYLCLVEAENCVSSTIITSPFEKNNEWYKKNLNYTYVDKRIGQVTIFPKNCTKNDGDLMDIFQSKVRQNIRKAEKNGVVVYKSCDDNVWKYLYETHVSSMEKIGGLAKKIKFFESVKHIFSDNKDYCIYVAEYKGEVIAACLLLYYNTTVEYFVPVTTEYYRNLQPLTKILYEAMKDSIKAGYDRWNWGGTWLTQGGVYDFKKKWGTEDLPYYYYNKIYDDKILKVPKQEILKEYENFFVFPFGEVE